MRVLVTGGAGYIGSHTLLELLGLSHEVFVLDNYDNASKSVLDRVRRISNGIVHDLVGDIRDPATLDSVMHDFRPDAVIHFAGLKSVGESALKPLSYYDVNVRGTLQVLSAMDRVDCRRIIFSSSATVYGEPQYLPLDEMHPTAPTSVYGRTKLMAEQIILDWSAARAGNTAVLLRYFNPVGAHRSTLIGEDPSGIPNNLMPYVAQVAMGKLPHLNIFGQDYDTHDGTGLRDYIHVVDLARAHVAALDWATAHTGDRILNIGTGEAYSVREMVAAFETASGREIPVQIAPRRQGDVAKVVADTSRAQKELGWTATHSLTDMVESSWAWTKANTIGTDAVDAPPRRHRMP